MLEISTRVGCKLQCVYCPQRALTKAYEGPRNLTPEVWEKCLKNIPEELTLAWTGFAEPFLNPQCMTLMKMAWNHKFRLATTFAGATVADVEAMAEREWDAIVFHVPTANGDMVLDVNDEYLALIGLAARLFIQKTPRHRIIVNQFGFIEKRIYDALSPYVHLRGPIAPNSRSALLGIRVLHQGAAPPCAMVKSGILIPDGRVVLCCNDYALKHVLGNLTEMPYDDLFKSDEFNRVMSARAGNTSISCICTVCDNPQPPESNPR